MGNLIYYLQKKFDYSRREAVNVINKIKIEEPYKKELTTIQSVKLVKKFGGIPVLAHPWINPLTLDENFIKKLIKYGLEGIEIEAGEGYNKLRTKKIVDKIKKLAKRFNLILTAGSDYHGENLVKETKRHKLGRYVAQNVIEDLIIRGSSPTLIRFDRSGLTTSHNSR